MRLQGKTQNLTKLVNQFWNDRATTMPRVLMRVVRNLKLQPMNLERHHHQLKMQILKMRNVVTWLKNRSSINHLRMYRLIILRSVSALCKWASSCSSLLEFTHSCAWNGLDVASVTAKTFWCALSTISNLPKLWWHTVSTRTILLKSNHRIQLQL